MIGDCRDSDGRGGGKIKTQERTPRLGGLSLVDDSDARAMGCFRMDTWTHTPPPSEEHNSRSQPSCRRKPKNGLEFACKSEGLSLARTSCSIVLISFTLYVPADQCCAANEAHDKYDRIMRED